MCRLFSLLLFMCSVISSLRDIEEFIPSHEWQVVKPGQAIPSGLHVRHDLQTGLTQAKLMDNNDSKSNGVVVVRDSSVDIGDSVDVGVAPEQQTVKTKMNVTIDGRFKSYKQLKDDYEKIIKAAKSESALLDQLYESYRGSEYENETIFVLEQMEDLLRKYDNAFDFATNGKLTQLMMDLPKSSPDVSVSILSCLAAALQGNLQVKLIMHRDGLLNVVAQKLHQELYLPSSNPEVIAQCLLVLSAHLRTFPPAQKVFFGPKSDGSIPVGYDLLSRTLTNPSIDGKVKIRLYSLLGELVFEQTYSQAHNITEKIKQYSQIQVVENLPKYGLCQRAVASLFDPCLTQSLSYRQRVMRALKQIASVCDRSQLFPVDSTVYPGEVKQLLDKWESEYAKEAALDSDPLYTDLLQLVQSLRTSLVRPTVDDL